MTPGSIRFDFGGGVGAGGGAGGGVGGTVSVGGGTVVGGGSVDWARLAVSGPTDEDAIANPDANPRRAQAASRPTPTARVPRFTLAV
jgi:hypothetical protein